MQNNFSVCHVNLAKGFRGGERQTEILIEKLSEYPIQQYLVCREDSPLVGKVKKKNINLHLVKGRCSGHIVFPKNISILHAHEPKGLHWSWIEHKIRNLPYIVTRRVTHEIKNTIFNKYCYKNSEVAVAISSVIKRYLEQKRWTRVEQIPSAFSGLPFDKERALQIRAKFTGKYIVGHIGALVDKHKGQREIIKAARRLQVQYPDLVFIMLGSGKDADALKKESYDLPNIVWEGFQENLGDYLAAMDLFVFPSRYEGLGSVLLDAMDFGIPIVATAVEGIGDIVKHEHTGLLVRPNDEIGLAESVGRIFDDKALGRRLALAAKNELQEFSPEKMAEGYYRIYQKVLGII